MSDFYLGVCTVIISELIMGLGLGAWIYFCAKEEE